MHNLHDDTEIGLKMTAKSFWETQTTVDIAQGLLGCLLTYDDGQHICGGRIVETEAYLGEADEASHAYQSRQTKSNQALYGPGGSLYVYTMRGLFLLNIVTQAVHTPQCVLIRGLEPTLGLETMAKRRQKSGVALTNGPAKLTQALGLLTRSYNGLYWSQTPLKLNGQKRLLPAEVCVSPRIGVPNKGQWTQAALRFFVSGNPYVSKIHKNTIDYEKRGWQ